MIATVLILALLAGAVVVSMMRGAIRQALLFGALASLPATTLIQALSWPALLVAGAVLALVAWHRWSRSRSTVS